MTDAIERIVEQALATQRGKVADRHCRAVVTNAATLAYVAACEACAKAALGEHCINIDDWVGTKKQLTATLATRIAAACRELAEAIERGTA